MHCDLLGRTAAHSSLLGRWNWVRGAFGNKQPNKDWANSFKALITRCQLPASSYTGNGFFKFILGAVISKTWRQGDTCWCPAQYGCGGMPIKDKEGESPLDVSKLA